MRLRHIEIFEAIRRTGSLTEAAAALHISQPAASKLLAHAEPAGFQAVRARQGQAGGHARGRDPDARGGAAEPDLNSVRRLAASLRDRPHGHLRLGSAPALGLGLLPGVVRASRDAHPGVTFDLHTYHSAELVQGLLTRELDAIVTFDTNDYPGLTRIGLGQTELVHLSRIRERVRCAGRLAAGPRADRAGRARRRRCAAAAGAGRARRGGEPRDPGEDALHGLRAGGGRLRRCDRRRHHRQCAAAAGHAPAPTGTRCACPSAS